MTDKDFLHAIAVCKQLALKHRELTNLVFSEYRDRYGFDASEIDDDTFLDTVLYGNGVIESVGKIEDSDFLKREIAIRDL